MADDKNEKSPGGSAILRHEAVERAWTAPAHAGHEEEICAHLSRYFGKPDTVFHEIVSDLVHIDVHVIKPSPERPHWTLVTTGMSALPMTVPQGREDFRLAELMISLPERWPVDTLKATPPPPALEAIYWPIRWLKQLARFPHDYKTWLGIGHSVPNGDPARPFHPSTKLCGWLLLPPISVPPEATTVPLSDGGKVHLYALHALHPAELSLKLNRGTDALLDEFDRVGVSEVLDVARAPVVKKKLFGLFG